MGKGRAPCCAKVGLKRGPWTAGEDMKLIAYIQKFGHDNWRALPKHAGLLRCGKSCRLRWINYLRPDLKRGNYTQEEEETIIKLHDLLGNKWSKIASQLPGRTDNEIKNVWHTHLKKKSTKKQEPVLPPPPIQTSSSDHHVSKGLNPDEEQIDQMEKVHESLNNQLIEVPIDPNMDIWSLFDDGSPPLDINTQSIEVDSICKQETKYSADKPQPTMSNSPTSSTSSTNISYRSCLSQLSLSDEDSIFAEKDLGQFEGVMNFPNEYNMDMWGFLEGQPLIMSPNGSVGPDQRIPIETQNPAKYEIREFEDVDDKSWLIDLENELELNTKKDEEQSLGAEGLDEPMLDYLPTIDGTLELDLDVDPIVAYFQMHPSSPPI